MINNQNDIDRHIDKLIAESEHEAEKILATRLKHIKQSFAEMLDKYQHDDPHITWTEFNKYNRFKKELQRIEELLQDDYSEIINLIVFSQAKVYLDSYMRHMYLFEQSSQIAMTFTVPSTEQIKQALAQPIDLIKLAPTFERHRKQVIQRLQGHIANGLMAGNSYNQIAHEINNDMKWGMHKSRMVARTETHRAQTQSGDDAAAKAKSFGARIKGYWDATLDRRTRLSHQKMDGKPEDEKGMFKVGLSVGPSPGNLVGVDSAKQNINCRCKKLYRVNGQMPSVRRTQDGLIPYMTYEQWEKEKMADAS
ncbi:phage minor head protein [Salinicoccus roseus]|uniref:phage minor head protein n=1 Tax=Salinicoccus roseus TaxID=45670 RepID=UPI003523279C